MSKNYPNMVTDLNALMGQLQQAIPDTMKGFGSLMMAATKTGALDKKNKELIALGIAIAVRCDGCIGMHVEKLIKLGITKEEFFETLSMAIYMGGGPSLMYAAEALKAFEQFSNPK